MYYANRKCLMLAAYLLYYRLLPVVLIVITIYNYQSITSCLKYGQLYICITQRTIRYTNIHLMKGYCNTFHYQHYKDNKNNSYRIQYSQLLTVQRSSIIQTATYQMNSYAPHASVKMQTVLLQRAIYHTCN